MIGAPAGGCRMPGFVGGNLRFMFEGEADIVQPLEQAMANEFIHRELRGEAPVVTHFAAFEVNRELIILRLTGSPDQLRDFRFAETNGEKTIFAAVIGKDVGERRRNHGAKSEIR